MAAGLLTRAFVVDPWTFSHKELKYAAKFLNYDFIEDRHLDDDDLLPYIHVPSLTKEQIVRIIGRNRKFLDYIELDKYDFRAINIRHLLIMDASFYDLFKIGEKEQSKLDALALLTSNKEELISKIDIKKHDFTGKENFAILQAQNFKEKTMAEINLETLKEYHIAEILIETCTKYLDLFDISKLSANRWAHILSYNEEMLKHCDFNVFRESDIYYSVILVSEYEEPDYTYLIDERDYHTELSALGWTKLLITHPDKYINECNLCKLSESNWSEILNYHPNLIVYKP